MGALTNGGKAMTTATMRPVEEPLVELLQRMKIARSHVAARNSADLLRLAINHADRVASLSVVCPSFMEAHLLQPFRSRLLVITGDQGPTGERTRFLLNDMPGTELLTLHNYESLPWSDVIADHTEDIGGALLEFLDHLQQDSPIPVVNLAEEDGEFGGISYRIRGSGPPLLLLPLDLASSQWEPLVPRVSARYCTITVGGAALGAVGALETRARLGYLGMVRNLLDAVKIKPGDRIIEIGCGSGVVMRELARQTQSANHLLGLEISPYLRREAASLAKQEGLGRWIAFQKGNAEALPLATNSVDVALSCTVLEEGNADLMLSELVRVTKPGGRIGVIVRALDLPSWVNLPLDPSLKSKVERPGLTGGSVTADGCADASLYRRFSRAGLTELHCTPQFIAVTPAYYWFASFPQRILAILNAEETAQWQQAVAQAEAEGTFFIGWPHHCAVGTKPL
jgi:SAM-dependent methyltransferase